jgi:hypothetical protein
MGKIRLNYGNMSNEKRNHIDNNNNSSKEKKNTLFLMRRFKKDNDINNGNSSKGKKSLYPLIKNKNFDNFSKIKSSNEYSNSKNKNLHSREKIDTNFSTLNSHAKQRINSKKLFDSFNQDEINYDKNYLKTTESFNEEKIFVNKKSEGNSIDKIRRTKDFLVNGKLTNFNGNNKNSFILPSPQNMSQKNIDQDRDSGKKIY